MPPSGQPWIIPQLASNDDKSRVLRFINVLHYYHGIEYRGELPIYQLKMKPLAFHCRITSQPLVVQTNATAMPGNLFRAHVVTLS